MFRRWLVTAALLAMLATPVFAQPIGETLTPVFREAIPNIPGKTLSALVVSYEPGGTSSSHRHAASAFVFAYVLSGAIRSQVGDAPARVYRAGESFFETPGAHHAISENASPTEPAQLLAVFVVDTKDDPLTIPDRNSGPGNDPASRLHDHRGWRHESFG